MLTWFCNEHFLQGIPSVFLEKIEDVENEGQRITVKINSLPAPFYVQWSAKSKNDENFRPIDLNTKEYEGTTISFPHPVLVVRQKYQLEKKCFRIEVKNFIGKTVHEISGKMLKRFYMKMFWSVYQDLQSNDDFG